MNKKIILIILIVLMSIGFASISTTLIINGFANVSENTDDFSVIFTEANLDGVDIYNTSSVSNDKKSISFKSSELKRIGDESILKYEVTNNSSQYDASVSVNCYAKDGTEAIYSKITNQLDGNIDIIRAKSSAKGEAKITLVKNSTEDIEEEYTCSLEFTAEERTKVGVSTRNLYDLIALQSVGSSDTLDYRYSSKLSKTNGVYQLADNKDIYFYRGNVNNNIIFGDFCWKIIRTTTNKGIRLLYAGKVGDNNTCTNTGDDATIGKSMYNIKAVDNAYVGYMHGTANASSYEETHTNSGNSTIKTYVDLWYIANMLKYKNYIEDDIYCNDRTMVNGGDNNTLSSTDYKTLGYGKNGTGYGALARASNETKVPKPTLECKNLNDRFTVSSANGNGKLTYPVGLITLDEAIYGGYNTYASGVSSSNNSESYLSGSAYWTMTPSNAYPNAFLYIGYLKANGSISNDRANVSLGVRPVISLKYGTGIEMSGTGTQTDPYIVY